LPSSPDNETAVVAGYAEASMESSPAPPDTVCIPTNEALDPRVTTSPAASFDKVRISNFVSLLALADNIPEKFESTRITAEVAPENDKTSAPESPISDDCKSLEFVRFCVATGLPS
jgi:hypothetical protein